MRCSTKQKSCHAFQIYSIPTRWLALFEIMHIIRDLHVSGDIYNNGSIIIKITPPTQVLRYTLLVTRSRWTLNNMVCKHCVESFTFWREHLQPYEHCIESFIFGREHLQPFGRRNITTELNNIYVLEALCMFLISSTDCSGVAMLN